MKRYRKDRQTDGWPIREMLTGQQLDKDEIVNELNKQAKAIIKIAAFVNDDSQAAKYQTLVQYRKAVLDCLNV